MEETGGRLKNKYIDLSSKEDGKGEVRAGERV
jgi:hypothetical protein